MSDFLRTVPTLAADFFRRDLCLVTDPFGSDLGLMTHASGRTLRFRDDLAGSGFGIAGKGDRDKKKE
jgi:hypothetical protein